MNLLMPIVWPVVRAKGVLQNRMLLTGILLCFAVFTFAQDDGSEIEEEVHDLVRFQVLQQEMLPAVNEAFVQQIGNENTLTIVQEFSRGETNRAEAFQQGQANNAYLEQIGAGHSTNIYQDGLGNEANSWAIGERAFTEINQNGDNNLVNSYIFNSRSLFKGAVLIQEGNNNRIDLAYPGGRGTAAALLPEGAVIRQQGNDLSVTALFDSYRPITIVQQSGTGGMNITVASSAFSFPMKRY